MREVMLLAARSNIVCRQRRQQVWLASPGAKHGFLVSLTDAPSLICHGKRMYSVALAQGFDLCR